MNIHILQHSLGLNQYGQGEMYRNYFATSTEGKDYRDITELVNAGLMQDHGENKIYGGMHVFSVTEKGIEYVKSESPLPPPEPKMTRSQKRYKRFLEYGDGFNSFIEFCRWDSEPERSWNS
jgi:hypothetical protein